jgi:hypothetical protein
VQLLSGISPGEAEHRSAINRAYYTAYGEARQGYQMNLRRSSHEQIWQYLRSGGPGRPKWLHAALKAIGDSGISLRAMRVQADYQLNGPPTEQEAKVAVSIAQTIVKKLLSLP